MAIVLLNDTRADPNPGCQATVSALVRQLEAAPGLPVIARPRGEGYECFDSLVRTGRSHLPGAWRHAVDELGRTPTLAATLASADVVVANLEGTFHHHTVGALALGGAIALAHRLRKRVWAVNGTVEAIDPWLLAETLGPAEHVAVREPASARWLDENGVTATSAADAAFLAENFLIREAHAQPPTRSAFYTPGVLAGLAAVPADAVREALDDLAALASSGWHPVFAQIEDRETALRRAVGDAGWPTADARLVPWPAFGAHLRRHGLVVSGRYHVLIFAAMAGVPAIAKPSNTFKIDGLLDLLDRRDALARSADDLAALAEPGAPPPVSEARIRLCQRRAAKNTPRGARPGGEEGAPCVVGLDWTPGFAIPDVLAGLRRSGPAAFRTSVSTAQDADACRGVVTLRTPGWWQRALQEAGFEAQVDRAEPDEDVTGGEAGGARAPWPRVSPFCDETPGIRHVFAVRRAPDRPRSDFEQPGRDTSDAECVQAGVGRADVRRVAVIVGSLAEFEWYLRPMRRLPRRVVTVFLRRESDDVTWTHVARMMAGWCANEGFWLDPVEDPGDLPAPHADGEVLLVGAPPDPACRRTFHAGWYIAARRRGWRTRDLSRAAGTIPGAPAPDLEGVRDQASPGVHDGRIRLALFGAGGLGGMLVERVRSLRAITPVTFLDNAPSAWGAHLAGLAIARPTGEALDAVDAVLVSTMHVDAVVRQVIDLGHGHKLLLDVDELERALGDDAVSGGSGQVR